LKDSSTANTAVCIAGAHRSGTSMLTRLLHTCGLYLGPESELMPAQADNPEGFWEHLGFVALNDELLNELGGAWDLPPKPDENFADPRLDPLRMKARLLIEGFHSACVWGWKDPRSSLTLPFWQDLLPKLKTLIVVRNPLEVAYSMRERNGTSYSFGLRLWEIYNQRLIETTKGKDRLVTHYDFFFGDAERELRRIARFVGLPDAEVESAAALVAARRRHTHFTIDQMIDARVSAEVIELYRALIAEASARRRNKGKIAKTLRTAKPREANLLPGAVSRLNAFIPERIAQVEHLYRELLAQTEARHKIEIEKLSAHLAQTEARHKSQVEELNAHLAQTEARHKTQVEELLAHAAETEVLHKTQVEELSAHVAQTEARHKIQVEELLAHAAQVEELSAHYTSEIEQLRDRIMQMNRLLHERNVNLAEDERYIGELTDRLRKQLWNTRRLSHLLEDVESAAGRLRTSRRWKLANPGATLKAKLSHGKVSMGYGHLEKIVDTYSKWRIAHPEIAKIDDEIKAAQVPKIPRNAAQLDEKIGSSEGTNSVDEVAAMESGVPNKAPAAPAAPVPSLPLRSLHFPAHKEVEVSVIIPVFNQLPFTHACLASLQTVQERSCFEVIVVDDCSTDSTPELVSQIDGIIYLRNETNAGFITSCNRGAEKARGKYLFFLNNDTIVKDGWLSALIDTFAEEPQAGVVGSKLVYPDGRLQEAGGIIWRDASGWNYGKSEDPEKPEYNYLREVDYCSAAALMIPKSLFHSVGGFDSRYAPAYYEDTDLSFKVRRAGYKVLYQPLSEVIHYEGATGGTDLATGTKKHQDINRATFAERWDVELMAKPVNGDLTFLRHPPPGRKNILVIDHHVPMPDKDSGSVRMFQILKLLHQLGHRVTFIPDNLADIPPYTGELQRRGIQVFYHPHIKSMRDYLSAHGSEFDAVVLSRRDFARKHITDVRMFAPQSRIIFDTVDLHFLREDREARLTGDPEVRRNAQEKQRLEHELIDQSDETWVVSCVEQQLLQEKRPDKPIQVVSNIVEIPGSSTPFALRRDWLFIGGFQHAPNIDAVLFFLKEIHPLVSKRLRDAKFYIIGDKAPPEVVALATETIIVAGLQTDAGPFFDSVKLSVAPLRFGAGVKGKINQSMACGVPVVATSLAVEGMALQNGEDILVADEPEDFARAMVELYESEDLWNRISENGIKKTRALYSTDTAHKKLELLFSDEHLSRLEQSAAVAQPDMAIAATS
jgi:GT2 family glycosyltransferase/glycosyltransferase involved in cell wall biosynthesis/predicted  nucleic acid-binding Zn-ribbon protein